MVVLCSGYPSSSTLRRRPRETIADAGCHYLSGLFLYYRPLLYSPEPCAVLDGEACLLGANGLARRLVCLFLRTLFIPSLFLSSIFHSFLRASLLSWVLFLWAPFSSVGAPRSKQNSSGQTQGSTRPRRFESCGAASTADTEDGTVHHIEHRPRVCAPRT